MHEVAFFDSFFGNAAKVCHRNKSATLIPSADNIPSCKKSRRMMPSQRVIELLVFIND